MPKETFDYVELDRVLREFFARSDMMGTNYILTFCNAQLSIGVCSNIADQTVVEGVLRAALKKIETVDPEFFESGFPTTKGNA